jgi:hypothetical protein
MSPDLVWIKSRSTTYFHFLVDIVRGANKELYSNDNNSEQQPGAGSVSAFNSDGFDLTSRAGVNNSSTTYVAWTWDGGTSTVSNTDGSITSSVRANTSAGFSIVTASPSNNAVSIGHGLNAAPSMIISKSRTVTYDWNVYHASLGGDEIMRLNTTAAKQTVSNYYNSINSSTFSVISGNNANNSGDMVYYCFAPVAGYSAFGSYTGNGSSDPKWIMFKASSTTGRWVIHDTERAAYNASDSVIYANESDAEYTNSAMAIDIVSNGFKIRTGSSSFTNSSGVTYIWAAFCEHPFKTARAR